MVVAITLLRACGGNSTRVVIGWQGYKLFSAHAEVIPVLRQQWHSLRALLRACGGNSGFGRDGPGWDVSSPRMRR